MSKAAAAAAAASTIVPHAAGGSGYLCRCPGISCNWRCDCHRYRIAQRKHCLEWSCLQEPAAVKGLMLWVWTVFTGCKHCCHLWWLCRVHVCRHACAYENPQPELTGHVMRPSPCNCPCSKHPSLPVSTSPPVFHQYSTFRLSAVCDHVLRERADTCIVCVCGRPRRSLRVLQWRCRCTMRQAASGRGSCGPPSVALLSPWVVSLAMQSSAAQACECHSIKV